MKCLQRHFNDSDNSPCWKIILGLIRHFALKGAYKLIISLPEFFKVITDVYF